MSGSACDLVRSLIRTSPTPGRRFGHGATALGGHVEQNHQGTLASRSSGVSYDDRCNTSAVPRVSELIKDWTTPRKTLGRAGMREEGMRCG